MSSILCCAVSVWFYTPHTIQQQHTEDARRSEALRGEKILAKKKKLELRGEKESVGEGGEGRELLTR